MFYMFCNDFFKCFHVYSLQLFQALVRSSSCLLGTPYQSLQSSNYVLTQLFITLIMSASTNYFVYSKLWSLFEFLCHSSTCIWLWHFFQKGRILLIHNHYIHWIRVICYDVYMTDFRFLVLVVSYGITMILRISGRYSQEFYLWT
jgi:hypothetical protein